MKNLIILGGTMGVGKTATSRALQKMLPDCVFLDGDWCWDSHPFIVTGRTKAMVMQNIGFLLNGFLRCPDYKNVVFCWVMHEQEIIDDVLRQLEHGDYQLHVFSLVCTEEALVQRLSGDVENGVREADIIERSVARLPCYHILDTTKIDVSDITPQQAAQTILKQMPGMEGRR